MGSRTPQAVISDILDEAMVAESWGRPFDMDDAVRRILAATEEPGLDVERLTMVLWSMVTPARDWLDAKMDSHRLAELIAAEYAALARQEVRDG